MKSCTYNLNLPQNDYSVLKYVDFYTPDLTNFDCFQDIDELINTPYELSSNNDLKNVFIKIPWGAPKNESQDLDKLKKSIENNPDRVFLRTQNLDYNHQPIRGSYNYYSITYTNPFCPNLSLPSPFFENIKKKDN